MESASKAVSSLGLDLFSLVSRYLRGEVFVGNIHRWLALHTSWLLTAPPDSATELAGALELALAEMELGHATESDLRSGILEFLRTHGTLRLATTDYASVSSSIILSPVAFPLASLAGRPREAACV